MAERIYKRLPGTGYGALSISSLWEAKDHLLLVNSYRFAESYRRFFYRDIQAIVLCRTRTWLILGSVFAIPALVLAALAATETSTATQIVFGILAALCGLVAAFQFLSGPTCRCTLRTAVQTHRLGSVTRLRVARKVISRIQPAIEAAQARPVTAE